MQMEEGGCKQMEADADGRRRMEADIMYQFESAIIRLNQFFSVFKEVNNA